MRKALQVAAALKTLIATALPLATVLGLEPDEAKPQRLDAQGEVSIEFGDPGPAEVDLSPAAYNFDHDFPVSVSAADPATLDSMLVAIGAAIGANRTLAGLCTWLDADAPTQDDADLTGAAAVSWAELRITASYTTSSPLA